MTFEQAKSIMDNKDTCFYVDSDGKDHEVEILSITDSGYAYIDNPNGVGEICVGLEELEVEELM